jgi:hypothetical protein
MVGGVVTIEKLNSMGLLWVLIPVLNLNFPSWPAFFLKSRKDQVESWLGRAGSDEEFHGCHFGRIRVVVAASAKIAIERSLGGSVPAVESVGEDDSVFANTDGHGTGALQEGERENGDEHGAILGLECGLFEKFFCVLKKMQPQVLRLPALRFGRSGRQPL